MWQAATVHAAPVEAEPPSVVLSPHFRVFADLEGQQSAAEATRAFYRGAHTHASQHRDLLYLVTQSDLERAVKATRGFEDKLKIAELSSELGIDKYKKLDVGAAQQRLAEALDIYGQLNYGIIRPERVADIALYLALSYIEQDDFGLELYELLQMVTLLEPNPRIREGYYPARVVRSYRDARASLIRTLRQDGPERSPARALASFADTDFAVFAYVWPAADETYTAAMFVYSQEEGRFLPAETLRVASLDPETLRAAGNRLMSRFIPCFVRAPVQEQSSTVVQSAGDSPFSLEFGAAYASFLQFPRELQDKTKPWANFGLAVNARLWLTPDFGIVAGVHILNSLRDYAWLIANDFSTLRGFVGGDMGIELGDFNVGIQVSAEMTTLGDFEAYVDLPCAAARDDCGKVRFDGQDFLVGVNARPRVVWNAYRQFSLVGAVSGTYYFIPLSGRDFNFPLTGELGVSYRF